MAVHQIYWEFWDFLVYFLFHGLMFYNPAGVGWQQRLGLCFGACSGRLIFQESHYRASLILLEFRANQGQGVRLLPALVVTSQHRIFRSRVHMFEAETTSIDIGRYVCASISAAGAFGQVLAGIPLKKLQLGKQVLCFDPRFSLFSSLSQFVLKPLCIRRNTLMVWREH